MELHDANENIIAHKEGTVDKFVQLVEAPEGSPYRAAAHVSGQYGTQYNFGQYKLSFSISVVCDQNAAMIDKAAELIFYKAIDLTEEGMKMILEAEARNNPK